MSTTAPHVPGALAALGLGGTAGGILLAEPAGCGAPDCEDGYTPSGTCERCRGLGADFDRADRIAAEEEPHDDDCECGGCVEARDGAIGNLDDFYDAP